MLNKAHQIKLNPTKAQKVFFAKSFGVARFSIGVYKLKWDNNQYYYYGSSIDLNRRKRNHIDRLKNGKHENFLLLKIYNKYGLPSFEVVEFCDINELEKVEQKYLDTVKNDVNNLNLLSSTKGAGRTFTKEAKEKISNSLKGRKFSSQHIENLKIANKGIKNPNYGNVGHLNPNAKSVINTKTGVILGSAKEASLSIGMGYSCFLLQIRGVNKNITNFEYMCGESLERNVQRTSMKHEITLFNNKSNI